MTTDARIKKLLSLTDNFIFPEFYPHTGDMMWKILYQYTEYRQEKVVLCHVSDGIDRALDTAIEWITKKVEAVS